MDNSMRVFYVSSALIILFSLFQVTYALMTGRLPSPTANPVHRSESPLFFRAGVLLWAMTGVGVALVAAGVINRWLGFPS
jgi:hypothetical protein